MTIPDNTKKCSNVNGCGKFKKASEFYKSSTNKDGLQYICKECKRRYADEHKEQRRINSRKRYMICAEKRRAQSREWRNNNLEKVRHSAREHARRTRKQNPELHHKKDREGALRKNYGLSHADYEEMLKKQNGVCAICKRSETMKSKHGYLCVDHAHGSNPVIVRGLLCSSCNQALGKAGDSIERLQEMILYLSRYEAAKKYFGEFARCNLI